MARVLRLRSGDDRDPREPLRSRQHSLGTKNAAPIVSSIMKTQVDRRTPRRKEDEDLAERLSAGVRIDRSGGARTERRGVATGGQPPRASPSKERPAGAGKARRQKPQP